MSLRHLPAPAKLNLFLHVTGRRDDGYHVLESLVAFTEFGDVLDIAPSDTLSLEITGEFAPLLRTDAIDNLVMRTARALQSLRREEVGARLTLHKHIPVGAGLGGGSSDAAAALRGLAALWQIDAHPDAALALGAQLGSDVPVCLQAPHICWVEGIGEKVTPVRLPVEVWTVLANPGVTLSTPYVFERFSGPFSPGSAMPVSFNSAEALVAYLKDKHNVLEAPARGLVPVIGEVLKALAETKGCLLSRMSGSGATCFGLYASEEHAVDAAQALQAAHPSWWCVATRLQHG